MVGIAWAVLTAALAVAGGSRESWLQKRKDEESLSRFVSDGRA